MAKVDVTVSVDTDDIVGDVPDDDLVEEVRRRGIEGRLADEVIEGADEDALVHAVREAGYLVVRPGSAADADLGGMLDELDRAYRDGDRQHAGIVRMRIMRQFAGDLAVDE